MIRISNIISMPIISLYESECLGYIYNITFDYKLKKCRFACIFNERDNINNIISCADIYAIGKDCVFIKNSDCIQLQECCEKEMKECKNPINFKCYNIDGVYLGIASDIEVDKNYNMIKIILDNGQVLPTSNILNIGNLILISDNKIKISKFKPFIKTTKTLNINTDYKVSMLNNTTPANHIPPANNKIITDYRFLVGRIITKDILSLNGEIIAKKDSSINKDTVKKASLYGKLVEIARYSKKTRQNV